MRFREPVSSLLAPRLETTFLLVLMAGLLVVVVGTGIGLIGGVTRRGHHYLVNGERRVLSVDNVVLCTGQEPNRALYGELVALERTPHLIGGANVASQLDAKRAIDEGIRLAGAM